MAGSLSHLVDKDGAFTFSLIENMRDAHEACQECFDIIAALLEESDGDWQALHAACVKVDSRMPRAVPMLGTRAEPVTRFRKPLL